MIKKKLSSNTRKKAIVFIDGNNWYHNVKSIIEKPRAIDFRKLANMIAENFDLNVTEIRYYNSTPDIELGDEVYYKHMVFLASLKRKGLKVMTRKLKKIKVSGKVIRVEKGIDVMISADMMRKALVENACDCCVLITGDSDFVPVMQLIKKAKKEVLTVSVLRGYARELLQGEFRFWILKKQDVVKCFGGYNEKER
ncbi:NYN domain-containing protein [Candidatus Pacearchaeota archaeon]|nr:NYN domain-containing protein [Candidatus Pacearchaeota archaeon]